MTLLEDLDDPTAGGELEAAGFEVRDRPTASASLLEPRLGSAPHS
jgi:hypothetical protein